MHIFPERLAFWLLRLNGFLTIPNFIVHPEGPREDGAYALCIKVAWVLYKCPTMLL